MDKKLQFLREMKGWTCRLALAIYLLVVVCSDALAQSREVSGTVTASDDNTTGPGVNILIKGTTTGTTTDAEGKFRLPVNDNSTVLEISSIGYGTQEIVVGTRSV